MRTDSSTSSSSWPVGCTHLPKLGMAWLPWGQVSYHRGGGVRLGRGSYNNSSSHPNRNM